MSRLRSLVALGPWWLAVVVVGAGLTWVVLGHIRQGGYVVGVGVGLGALLRLVLPAPRGGGLEVRSRGADVLMLLGLAVVVVVAFSLVRTTVTPL